MYIYIYTYIYIQIYIERETYVYSVGSESFGPNGIEYTQSVGIESIAGSKPLGSSVGSESPRTFLTPPKPLRNVGLTRKEVCHLFALIAALACLHPALWR